MGVYPYKGKTQVAIYNNIMNHAELKKRGKNDLLDDLISKLLKINPIHRMDWEEYFSHEFWRIKDPEEDSDSEENELNEENFVSSKKVQNNNDENDKNIGRKENEELNIKKKFNIFYSLSNEEKTEEVNAFSIARDVEEFPVVAKNKLKKIEIF